MKRSYSVTVLQRSGLIAALAAVMCGCISQPRVATSFWRIGTPADSDRIGYAILTEGSKVRHCYPVTEAFEPAWDPEYDTYHMFHHHGVAVESELMAYRIYFDKKQTIDVYCKRTPQLELAQSHWYPNDSLLAEGYGDDILRVSGTVGVGTVKYWNNKLYHIEEVGERQQWILRQTKNKAKIAVSDVDWSVPDGKQDDPETRKMVNLAAEYTMRAGHRDMRCDVKVSEPVSGLCTGVQTIPAKGGDIQHSTFNIQLQNGVLLASWGTDWPVNDSAKYAKETVGLAVFIPKAYAGEVVHDKQNLLCLLRLTGTESAGPTAQRSFSANGPTAQRSEMCTAHFYLTCCGATKENHPVATTAEEWLIYLRRWAKRLK